MLNNGSKIFIGVKFSSPTAATQALDSTYTFIDCEFDNVVFTGANIIDNSKRRTHETNSAPAPILYPAIAYKVVRCTSNSKVQIGIDSTTLAKIGDWFDVDSVGTGGLYIDPLNGTTLEVMTGFIAEPAARYGRLRIEKIAASKYKVTGNLKAPGGGGGV